MAYEINQPNKQNSLKIAKIRKLCVKIILFSSIITFIFLTIFAILETAYFDKEKFFNDWMIKNPEDDFIVLEQVVNAIIPAIWIHTFSIIIVGGLYYHTYQKIVSDSLRHIAYFIWMMVLGVITLNIGLIFVSIISLVQNYQNETK